MRKYGGSALQGWYGYVTMVRSQHLWCLLYAIFKGHRGGGYLWCALSWGVQLKYVCSLLSYMTWEKKWKDCQMHLHHFKLIFMNVRKPRINMYALLEGCSFGSFPVFSTFLQYQLQSARLWISVLCCLHWRQDFSPEMLDSNILGN